MFVVTMQLGFHYSIVFPFQRQLDGYEFPVYTTTSCPRNETEFNARSIKANCTEPTSYMCLPNQNQTELVEFCDSTPGGIGVTNGMKDRSITWDIL